ncbi:MAG TPA: hypothetical protein VF778_00025, partial [Xanthobacteraceae bacterium]
VNYGLPGVIWLMIGLLVVQIVAVYFWGVEPAQRSLEVLDPKTGANSAEEIAQKAGAKGG